MARRVYAEFDTELQKRLSYRTDIDSTERGFYLNDALRLIINEFPHPEYEGLADDVLTTSGTLTPAATDFGWPVSIKDIDNNRIIDLTSRDDIEKNRITTGNPDKFYWWGGVLRFNRTPSANLDIRLWYKKTVAEWSTGSPGFDRQYDPLISMRAAAIALSVHGDQTAAHLQETEYNNFVSRFKFPTVQAELNDRRQGIQVRMR